MISKSKKICAAVAMLLTLSCGVAQESAEIESLQEALKSRHVNETLSEINEVKESPYKGESLQFMLSLWEGKNLPSGIDKEFVNKDIVRINIADALVQAGNNGLIEVDESEYRKYAQSALKSDDPQVVSAAMFVLGNIDNPEDVGLIEPLVHSESDYLFRSATLTLAMMCNDKAGKVLTRLEEEVEGSRQEHVKSTRDKFLSMKDKGFYCQ